MATFKPTAVEDRKQQINATHQLNRDRYVIRFTTEKCAPAKSPPNNPCVTLEAEIVASGTGEPTIVSNYTGITLGIQGASCKPMYLSLRSKKEDGSIDNEATQQAIDRFCDLRIKCGLEIPDEGVDPEQPPLGFKGVVVDAILDAEEFVQRKTPSPEQRAQGKPGDEILGQDGKPMKSYSIVIRNILGVSAFDASGIPF